MTTIECNSCSEPLEVAYLGVVQTLPGSQAHPVPPMPLRGTQVETGLGRTDEPYFFYDPWPPSLGEGNTPTVSLPSTSSFLGIPGRLQASLEYLNPTGSFKDRGTAMMMRVAIENGVREVVEDSSGNAGASIAAYSARAGIKAHVFVPDTAPEAKILQIRGYGAEVHLISGPRDKTTAAAIAFCKKRNLVYASHNLSPYFLEGTKLYAYELVRNKFQIPDHMVFPVGNGSLYIGTWIAFQELLKVGATHSVPRMHCAQPTAVMPIVADYKGDTWDPKNAKETVAGGIAVTTPPRRKRILNILHETNGVAVNVDDEDTLAWRTRLGNLEGIYAEATSAAAFAGLAKLVSNGTIQPNETVLVPITGFGLKDGTSI